MAEIEMGDASEIPDKPFYKIGEVCQYTDTQPYVIRFWESEFPQLSPGKGRSGQRVYRREDIDLILRIKKLLYEQEYTIAGARRRLDEAPEGDADGEDAAIRVERGAPPSREEPAPFLDPPDRSPTDAGMLEELESLRSRVAAAESQKERAEAQAEELLREMELLREGQEGRSPDLAQARLLAAEAARQAAERAVRIQRTKALEVAAMLEELLARIDALGGDVMDDGTTS